MFLCFSAIFGAEVNMINCDTWYMKEELKESLVYKVFIVPFHKQEKQCFFFSFIVLVPFVNWS